MSEFEDKLNKILSSPEDLQKIMNIAKSFSGGGEAKGAPTGEGGAKPGGSAMPDLSSMGSLLGNIDPKMIGLITRVMGEYSGTKNDKAALITALKPYLKEDRRQQIDKAAEMAKLARIATLAFSEFSGDKKDV